MAEKETKESEKYFRDLCESVGTEKTKLWTELEEQMQIQRDEDIRVMDQLDVKDRKGTNLDLELDGRRSVHVWVEFTKSDMTTLWVHKEFEARSKVLVGSSQWIASGIRLSEKQFVPQCLLTLINPDVYLHTGLSSQPTYALSERRLPRSRKLHSPRNG